MARLNGLYIFVQSETINRDVEVTSHSVEKEIDITDNVKRNAYTISISGKIVGEESAKTQAKIAEYMVNGIIVNYTGRNYMTHALITKFETSHPNTVYGGCDFSMEIKQVRVAKNSYKNSSTKTSATQKGGTQQVQQNNKSTAVYHTVKKGDTVWGLVAANGAPYKKYGKSCQWIMDNNPNAFSKKGDFKTLKIGAKLLVGYK